MSFIVYNSAFSLSVWPDCLPAVVRSGDYYLFETDSEEEEEEEKKQEDELKKEDLPEKSAFQVRLFVSSCNLWQGSTGPKVCLAAVSCVT